MSDLVWKIYGESDDLIEVVVYKNGEKFFHEEFNIYNKKDFIFVDTENKNHILTSHFGDGWEHTLTAPDGSTVKYGDRDVIELENITHLKNNFEDDENHIIIYECFTHKGLGENK